MNQLKKVGFCWIVVIVFFMSCSQQKALTKAEAEKALKVLDSDINRLLLAAAESKWQAAISSLVDLKGAPIPHIRYSSADSVKHKLISFNVTDKWAWPTGHYTWSRKRATFDFVSNSSNQIVVDYPLKGSLINNARCKIDAFENGQSGSYINIPSVFKATFWVDNRQVASFLHEMKVEQQVPVYIRLSLKGDEFESKVSLDNQLSGQYGQVKLNAIIEVLGQEVMDATVNCKIKLNGGGSYSIEDAHFVSRLFEIETTGHINYAQISPTSPAYDQEFNRYSKIQFEENGSIIGDVVLSRLPNEDRFDFFLKFTEGSPQPLSNYLLSFQKLMKY